MTKMKHALCHFKIPGRISIHNRNFSGEKTNNLAGYFLHFFEAGEAELLGVRTYTGEFEDDFQHLEPEASTFLCVSVHLAQHAIANWKHEEAQIAVHVREKLQKEGLRLASYIFRGEETRIYFIEEYAG